MSSSFAKKPSKPGKNQRWIPLSKSISATDDSPISSGRASPVLSNSSHSKSLTTLDEDAAQAILGNVREESRPTTPTAKTPSRSNSIASASFAKLSLTSIMPSFNALTRSRSNTNEDNNNRGRRDKKDKRDASASRDSSLARGTSPFRWRSRSDRSPSVEALRLNPSDVESDGESFRAPRNAFNDKDTPSDSEDEDEWDDGVDQETVGNTERNAAIPPVDANEEMQDIGPDPLGEGVNIVRAPEPLFPQQSIFTRKKKAVKNTDMLPLITSAPHFQRDLCTVTLTHGKPAQHCVGRPTRHYMVASDLSEESKYAVEWGIGTVLKDGDEMYV